MLSRFTTLSLGEYRRLEERLDGTATPRRRREGERVRAIPFSRRSSNNIMTAEFRE